MVSITKQADSDNLAKSANNLEETNKLIRDLKKNQTRNIIIGGLISGISSGIIVLVFSIFLSIR